jgi:tripartite-type tricarboxylate transporter receptor subunit TctC
LALIANPSFPAKSVADVIALAKQQRGKLNLGTTSISGYLCAELFKAATGADVVIIRYNGTASLVNDLIGGHVQVAFGVLPPALGNIRAGNLRVIAVTSATRSSQLPDVPTFDETGLPGFEAVLHYGLLAPAGTPEEIVDKLSVELRKLVDTDEVKQRIRAEGGDPVTSTPAEYAADIDKEVTKWSTLMRKLNLKVN